MYFIMKAMWNAFHILKNSFSKGILEEEYLLMGYLKTEYPFLWDWNFSVLTPRLLLLKLMRLFGLYLRYHPRHWKFKIVSRIQSE